MFPYKLLIDEVSHYTHPKSILFHLQSLILNFKEKNFIKTFKTCININIP